MLIPPHGADLIPLARRDFCGWSKAKGLSQHVLYERAELDYLKGEEIIWLQPGIFRLWALGELTQTSMGGLS